MLLVACHVMGFHNESADDNHFIWLVFTTMNAYKSYGMTLFSVGLGVLPHTKIFKIMMEMVGKSVSRPSRHRSPAANLQMFLMHGNLFLFWINLNFPRWNEAFFSCVTPSRAGFMTNFDISSLLKKSPSLPIRIFFWVNLQHNAMEIKRENCYCRSFRYEKSFYLFCNFWAYFWPFF